MRFIVAIALLLPTLAISQVGGDSYYQVLDLPASSRTAALAGTAVSLSDGDLSQFFENPAVLDSVNSKDIFFQINPYFTDAFVFSGAYAFEMKALGKLAVGLHYIDYGSFRRTDAAGLQLGEFQAQDYVISVGKSHHLGPITLGANLKLIHSSIDNYGSTAVAADVGGVFRVSPTWTVAMVFSNLGTTLSSFETALPSLPFDVKIGTTFKPEYMPFRFTITSGNLTQHNELQDSENQGRSNEGLEKALRRINFGAELLLSENFQLLFGYSHKKKQELKLDDIGGGAGFSYGLMVGIKRFQLRYSRSIMHAAGGSSFISLQTNISDFKRIL